MSQIFAVNCIFGYNKFRHGCKSALALVSVYSSRRDFMRRWYIVLLIMGLLLLSACGRGNRDESTGGTAAGDASIEYSQESNLGIAVLCEDEPPTQTLHIMAPSIYTPIIRQAERAMREAIELLPEDEQFIFNVSLTSFPAPMNDQEHSDQLARLGTALMAGQGPDMFFNHFHPLWAYARSGFLVDINTLIDSHPNTSREDFFSQALAASEIAGELYSFPVSFNFSYVFINSSLPQSIIDRFTTLETISVAEMLRIYNEVMALYGHEFGDLSFADKTRLAHPLAILTSYMDAFVDYDNRVAHFTSNEFISFLEEYNTAFGGSTLDILHRMSYSLLDDIRSMSEHNVFYIARNVFNTGFAFFENPYFSHGIPLSDTQGRLQIDVPGWTGSSTWAGISITASGNGALAWEFIQHLISAFSLPRGHTRDYIAGGFWEAHHLWGRYVSMASPITRPLFPYHIRGSFDGFFAYRGGHVRNRLEQMDAATRRQLTESAIEQIAVFNEMPMAMLGTHIPYSLFMDNLDLFLRNVIPPQEFAQRLQNSVSLWLIE